MTDKKRFVPDKNGWPYAFGHWLMAVGLDDGRTLDFNDFYALNCYRSDWEREGIKAPIYYSRARQDGFDADEQEANSVHSTLTQPGSAEDRNAAEDVAQFLRCLFAPYERGWIELRCLRFAHNEAEAATLRLFSPGYVNPKAGVRTWRRYFPVAETVQDAADLRDMADTAAANRYDVYLGILPRGTAEGRARKEVIYEAGALWAELDFDKQGGEEATLAKARAAEPDIIVRSGGGIHCYWTMTVPLSLDGETRPRFEAGLRARQDALGTDRTHDCTRILRLPTTWNWKSKEPRRVELLKCL